MNVLSKIFAKFWEATMSNGQSYRKMLLQKEYDFLRENPFLGENIALLTLGGSRAYGTNTEGSDVDIRGFAVNPSKQIFGLQPDFEQVVDVPTDTTIYSLNKMVKLLLACNPNTIEIFGCRPEDYLYVNEYGTKVLEGKEHFLSVKAIDSFGGYATQQYNRLQHGLLGNGENDDKKLSMLMHSLESSMNAFYAKHKDSGVNLSLWRASTEDLKRRYPGRKVTDENSNEHIIVTGTIDNVSVTEFKTVISELHKIQSEYGNINKRNTKKNDVKLAKHMMHLVRLYLMGTYLNESATIKTYIDGPDHEMLMDIRNGKYMTGDGMKVRPEFYDLLKGVQDRYEYAVAHTVLPTNPNYDAVNEMLLEIYKDRLNHYEQEVEDEMGEER